MLLALGACASGPTPSSPKSNVIARAKILSQNEISITIHHSDRGKATAFKWAEEHCRSLGKIALYTAGAPDFGPNTTSTWQCVKPS